MAVMSSSSCSNNKHCSKSAKPMSQQNSTALHDSTNGQVMADPGNSPPASSASSPHSRQRESLLYGLLNFFML